MRTPVIGVDVEIYNVLEDCQFRLPGAGLQPSDNCTRANFVFKDDQRDKCRVPYLLPLTQG